METPETEINIYPLFKFSIELIDTMLARGAIYGNEMLSIAQVREQMVSLVKFLEENAQVENSIQNKEETT